MGAVKERPAPLSSTLREMGFWGVAEAAEVLGLHEVTVRKYIASGAMESAVYGNRRVVPTSAIRSVFGDLCRDASTRDVAIERMKRHAKVLGVVIHDVTPDRGTHG